MNIRLQMNSRLALLPPSSSAAGLAAGLALNNARTGSHLGALREAGCDGFFLVFLVPVG